MSLIQFFGLTLAFAAVAKLIADYRKNRESRVMAGFWLFTWFAVMVFVVYPKLTDILIDKVLGSGQGIGTILGFGMILLLFLIYRLYMKTERIERKLKKYVTDLALKDMKKDK